MTISPARIPVKSDPNDTNIEGIQPTTKARIVEIEAGQAVDIQKAPIGHIDDGEVVRFVYQDDMRTCSECGRSWPATAYYFRPNPNRADGLDMICRDCVKESDTQRCTCCGEYKPLEPRYWEPNPHMTSGYRHQCRECRNKQRYTKKLDK